MKNLLLILAILCGFQALSQNAPPQGINFQGVAIDKNGAPVPGMDELGNPIQNAGIKVRFSILAGSATGLATYREVHETTTDEFGRFNVEIGRGSNVEGVFQDIQWGSNRHFLKVEVDLGTAGSNYQLASIQEFLSVPYALYSANGTPGPQGIPGTDGATGPQGPTGLTGAAGAAGATGPQGPIGLTGATGANGAQGTPGTNGATGPQGPIGLTGAAGATGATGPQGPIGLTGAAGAAGANGAQGTPGTNGATGPQGPIGLTGAQGTPGTNGATGPVGPTGPIGLTGAAGPAGAQGAPGTNGATGPQGPIGLTGAAGAAGSAGADGAQGAPGTNGATGPQGPIGLTGAAGGATGATGPQGPTGLTGAAGAPGPQGPIGLTGAAGTAGNNGIEGGGLLTVISSGFNYTISGFAGNFPTLTLVRGQLYYFNLNSVSANHPFALRLTNGNTSAVPGTTNNNPVNGNAGTNTLIIYRVPNDAPSSIVYQCVAHLSMIGTINIVDQNGAQGPIGLTGAAGATGPQGLLTTGVAAGNTPYWNGSQWVVNNSNIHNNGAGVGIGTSSPNASAKVEIASTTQGFLPPRLTTAQRDAIASPAVGLVIYNVTTNCLNFYLGHWKESCGVLEQPLVQPAYPQNIVLCTQGLTLVANVVNPTTNKIWMDRNLGATQVATSSTDALAYGDLYQWGRRADGHQCRTSLTTPTLSSVDQPANGNFILAPNAPSSWRSPPNDNLWQGVNGINNPCPSGYGIPTEVELNAERGSWSTNNAAGAFTSPLKLPMAGYRDHSNGSLSNVGTYGYYWSSTVSSTVSRRLGFTSSTAGMLDDPRANGFSVRCIKN